MDDKKDLLTFIIFAFLLPLLCSILIITFPICQSGGLNLVLYGIQGASPALAAIATILIRKSKIQLIIFLKEKYVSNISIKYCMVGFIIPAIILTIGKLLSNSIMNNDVLITLPTYRKFIIILWALIAEELGWRGYLQEKVESVFGACFTPLIVGMIWTFWHYHFFMIGSMEVPYMAFTYSCIVESYGYYVLTKISKGNIVPASLWHFSVNLFFNLYLINPNWNNGSILPYIIINGLYSIYIFFFVLYRKNTKFAIG